MLRNMITIAWRNAIRNKQFTLLNILGLSIGITATLIIGLFVVREMSYDNFHANADRIYRINQSYIWGDWDKQFASTGPNLAVALKTDVPEFEEVTRLHDKGRHIVSHEQDDGAITSFIEDELYIAESNFFRVFSFEVLKGNAAEALATPQSVVITEEIAEKYFGKKDPMGKTLKIAQGQGKPMSLQVAAITANPPINSHIQYDFLVSMSSYPRIKQREDMWVWTTFGTYGLVRPGTDVQGLEAKLQQIPPKWAAAITQRLTGKTYDEFVQGKKWSLYMQPIREAYIHAPGSGERFGPSGDFVTVQLFGTIGLLILFLSSINFMNLSTARSANRAKEVGIRKTLGSSKKTLIRQFIFESVLFVLFSTIIAIVATEMSLSTFNSMADAKLSLYDKLIDPVFLTSIVSFILGLGLLAGSYPAFYLSSFNPIEVLKGKLSAGFKGKTVRNGLVIFQFTITIALIISAIFVQKQLSYASRADLGFDHENVLQIHNIELLNENDQKTFQTLLRSNPAFEKVGLSDYVPPEIWSEDNYKAPGPGNRGVTLSRLRATEEYMDLLNLDLVAGRSFDKEIETDRYKVILNEAAVRDLGWGTTEHYDQDSPIGKKITFVENEELQFEVIGVIKNFNFNSVKFQIDPLLIIHENNDNAWESGSDFVSIRLNSSLLQANADMAAAIDDVRNKLQEVDGGVPFKYSFMDQDFETYFNREAQLGQVLNVFTAMALIIACLGLFGLAAFSAEQRKKELGVRKVLGASVYRLMYIFTAEFTMLILIALIIASPISFLFVKNWLANFAYKTPITPIVFILATVASLGLAWITIGFQSLRAANRNPVEVLRDS